MFITKIIKHLLASTLALLIAAPANAQTDASKAILILDASASMWGRIEDKPKIEIARKVIREILHDWNPSVELGLMAYGHREKGNCEDIQTLIDVGPVKADEMIKAADGLNPKGKTPLSRAVRTAAQKLRFTENKATVILVSDGKESCDMDPCQAAKELEENGIDFTAHVIGFQVLDDARRQLRCLAENTGGKFLSADNADELKSALTSAVETVAAEPVEEISSPTLHVTAVPHEGGEPITSGVTYDVFEGSKASKGKLIDSSSNARTFFHLPAGAYHVVAEHEGATTGTDVQVTDSKTTDLVMVLDGGRGRLRVKAVAAEGGEPLEGVAFSVYESKSDVGDYKKRIDRENSNGGEKSPIFTLPERAYHVVAEHRGMTSAVDIQLTAGRLIDTTIVMNSARLRVKAVAAEGGEPLEGVRFSVYERKNDAKDDRTRINSESSTERKKAPEFTLPAGTYYVVAEQDNAKSAVDVQLTAGMLTDASVVMNSGRLQVKAVAAEGGEPLEGVQFSVYESKGDGEGHLKKIDIKYSHGRQNAPVFTLPKGDYHVVAKHGRAESAIDVQVTARQLSDATIVMNSGRLRVKAIATEGGNKMEQVYFHLCENKDEDGKWESVVSLGDSREYYLKAGKYHINARKDKAVSEIDVEVNPGELTDATIAMDAGSISVKAVTVKDGESLENVSCYLYRGKSFVEGKGEMIAGIGGTREHVFFLNAGKYHLVLKKGLAKSAIDVLIQPGINKEATLVMNAGYLRMEVLPYKGGLPIEQASFHFYESKTNSKGKKDRIRALASKAPHLFFLNEGKYHIKIRSRGEDREVDVQVTRGEVNDISILLK